MKQRAVKLSHVHLVLCSVAFSQGGAKSTGSDHMLHAGQIPGMPLSVPVSRLCELGNNHLCWLKFLRQSSLHLCLG